jgi:O-antigen/teichoic acid export membrane protein
MARWVFAATAGLALGVALFGVPVIRLMGPGFEEAFGVLLWLLPGVALLAVARVMSADLAARGRPELNVAATLVALAVELAAIALLVPRMGIEGAAAASSLSYATVLLLVALLYARTVGQRPWALLMPTSDDRQVVSAIGAMLLGWLRAASPADRLRG